MNRLQAAVERGEEPFRRGDSLYLRDGRRTLRLTDGLGVPTELGRQYQRTRELRLFDHRAAIRRRGGQLLATAIDGRQHVVAQRAPGTEEGYSYTRLGTRFFRERPLARIQVQIPVFVHYKNRRPNAPFRVYGTDKAGAPLTIPLNLPRNAQLDGLDVVHDTGDLRKMKEFVREAVTKYIETHSERDPATGRFVLRDAEQSDAFYTFDPDRLGDFRGFEFSEARAVPRAGRAPRTEVILNRPLRGVFQLPEEMWRLDRLHPAATLLEHNGQCVKQQLILALRVGTHDAARDGQELLLSEQQAADLLDAAQKAVYERGWDEYLDVPRREALEPYVDLWKARLAPGVSKPIAELDKRLRNLTNRSRLPSLGEQLRLHFPLAHHDRHRLELFFGLFPERFTVYHGEMEVRVLMGHTAYRSPRLPLSPYSPGHGWREIGVTPLMIEHVGRLLGRAVHTFVNNTKISEYIPSWPSTGSALVYNVWGDHAFFYEHGIGLAASRVVPRPLREPPTVRLVAPREDVLEIPWSAACKSREVIPLYFHWIEAKRPVDLASFRTHLASRGVLEPSDLDRLFAEVISCNGVFCLEGNLRELSEELVELRIGHRRVYSSMTEIRALVLTPNVRAKIRVNLAPPEAPMLDNFCKTLSKQSGFDVPYLGDSTASVGYRALETLLRARRRFVPHAADIVRRQDGKCATCQQPGLRLEIHHVRPIEAGGTDDPDNLLALCRVCHEQETERQRLSRVSQSGLESLMSPRLAKLFYHTPKPPVWHGGHVPAWRRGCTQIDIRGCRRNALAWGVERLPVICPGDDLVPFELTSRKDLQRHDFFWIQVDDGQGLLDDDRMLLDGEHLYPLLTVEYMLDLSLIKPAQITHALRASRWVEPEEWRRACAIIKEACVKSYYEDASIGNYKLLINSAIGLMNRVDRFAYPVVRQGIFDDLERPNFISCGLLDSSLPSVAVQTRLLSARTAYPIGLTALHWECVATHKVRRCIRAAGGIVYASLVDATYFDGKCPCADELFPDETPMFQLAEVAHEACPNHAQTWERQHRTLPARQPWAVLSELDIACLCRMTASARPLSGLPRDALSLIAEFAGEPTMFSDTVFDQLADVIADNGGAMVTGPGGVGKTLLVRTLIDRMQRRDPQLVFSPVAVTHSASRLLPGGHTLSHALKRDLTGCNLSKRVFIVDEASMVPMSAWARMGEWLLMGARFVMLGDWDGQLLPISEVWGGGKDSDILRQLARSLEVRLVVNRRSDAGHAAYVASLYPCVAGDNHDLEDVRRRFPWSGTLKAPMHALVMSHRKRVQLNALLTEQFDRQRPGARRLEPGGPVAGANQPQAFWCYPGQLVEARVAMGKTLCNGVLYVVRELNAERVILDMQARYRAPRVDYLGNPVPHAARLDREEIGVELPLADAALQLRPTHALCYASAQGRTMDVPVLLLDTTHPHFTTRHLIVGLGRATAGHLVRVPTDDQERGLTRLADSVVVDVNPEVEPAVLSDYEDSD